MTLHASRFDLHRAAARGADLDEHELLEISDLLATERSVPDSVRQDIFRQVVRTARRNGSVSANLLAVMNGLIYGPAGSGGVAVSRDEAEMLFEVYRATAGGANVPEWADFFAGAICWFVMHDPESPGRIEHSEAGWLMEQFHDIGRTDPALRRLVSLLQVRVRTMPDYLQRTLTDLEAA
ncbi:MAG: hypothetical protein N2111_12610 [Candidatus Sumerlaeaceae bacterium]|nr:hypothetical protein [Candidatus Sumerlaeaceae bacterium]